MNWIKFDVDAYRKKRIRMLEKLYDETKSDFLQKKIMEIINNEERGGQCIECQAEYEKISDINGFVLYEPSCYCIPRCPHCKRILSEELMHRKLYWDHFRCNCGYLLIKQNKAQYGEDFESNIYPEIMDEYYKKHFESYGKKSAIL